MAHVVFGVFFFIAQDVSDIKKKNVDPKNESKPVEYLKLKVLILGQRK